MKASNWFIVNTNPRCEDMVGSILQRVGFETLLPKLKNSRKNKSEPLFPGYLFVRFNLNNTDWVSIKYMQGVRKILSYGHTIIPIPEMIIDDIKKRFIKDNNFIMKALSLKMGDKVRLLKGPFAGLEGVFTGEISGKDRVKILLQSVYSSTFKVETAAGEISKVG